MDKTMLEEDIEILKDVVEVTTTLQGLYKISFINNEHQKERNVFIADERNAVVYLQAIINYLNL